MSQLSSAQVIIPPIPGTGVQFLTGDNTAVLVPPNGVTQAIQILGGANINTGGVIASNSVTVNLNNSIILPATTVNLLSGVISIDGSTVLHTFGGAANGNIGIGTDALKPSVLNTGTFNTAVGTNALLNNHSGASNVAVGTASMSLNNSGTACSACGTNSLASNSTGIFNSAYGFESLAHNDIGSHNCAFGADSGLNNDANANYNINIGNSGGPGISNRITIGTPYVAGVGQNECFIYGIHDVVLAAGDPVTVSATGQLGRGPSCGSYGFCYFVNGDQTVLYDAIPPYDKVNTLGPDITVVPNYDPDGLFNVATGEYTIPISGFYSFTFNISLLNVKITNAAGCTARIDIGGITYPYIWSPYYSSGATLYTPADFATISFTMVLDVPMGDHIKFDFLPKSTGIASRDLQISHFTSISGYFIHS